MAGQTLNLMKAADRMPQGDAAFKGQPPPTLL